MDTPHLTSTPQHDASSGTSETVRDHTPDLTPDVVLGAMLFGTRTDEGRAFEILDTFVEAGGVWIDTADCYAFWADPRGVGGASEEVLGRWLRARPGAAAQVRISTKIRHQPTVAHRWPESAAGLSADAIRTCLQRSLERLGLDSVDLLWAHAEDRTVPLLETVEALDEAHRSGLVRRLGASNHATWRLERARRLATERRLEPFTAMQLRRSYVEPRPGAVLPDAGHRLADADALDYAKTEGLPLWAYCTLVNGAYTRPDKPFPPAYDHRGTERRLAALSQVAQSLDATATQVVLAWLLRDRPGTSPIVGVSSAKQLSEVMQARTLALTEEHLAVLDAPELR